MMASELSAAGRLKTWSVADGPVKRERSRYYACSSHPQVTVWKEEMSFVDTKDGYRVTESRFKVFDGISTREEFLDAYLVFDEYQFVDYEETYVYGMPKRPDQKDGIFL